jgi:hypothetical protein
MTSGDDSIKGTGAIALSVGLGAACPAAYFLIWDVLAGNSCGPPGNTTSGDVFTAAPFALPGLAVAIVLVVATTLKWRLWILLTALLTTIALAGIGEVVVFWGQFGAHHCGE